MCISVLIFCCESKERIRKALESAVAVAGLANDECKVSLAAGERRRHTREKAAKCPYRTLSGFLVLFECPRRDNNTVNSVIKFR